MGRNNLILIGFMGTGKSTVGALCAATLAYTFRDTDSLIVDRTGRSIPEIFGQEGEPAFRAHERDVISEIVKFDHQVVATGGGAILNPENASLLRTSGRIVLLTGTTETVMKRVLNDSNRPLLKSAVGTSSRIAERMRTYTACSDFSIDTDESPASEIAARICVWYKNENLNNPSNRR